MVYGSCFMVHGFEFRVYGVGCERFFYKEGEEQDLVVRHHLHDSLPSGERNFISESGDENFYAIRYARNGTRIAVISVARF